MQGRISAMASRCSWHYCFVELGLRLEGSCCPKRSLQKGICGEADQFDTLAVHSPLPSSLLCQFFFTLHSGLELYTLLGAVKDNRRRSCNVDHSNPPNHSLIPLQSSRICPGPCKGWLQNGLSQSFRPG